MALPGFGPLAPPGDVAPSAAASEEDPSLRIRKPYTITKSRESWTEPEHDKFLEALQLFDRDWKKIEAFVGSKTVIQIRSHAQKYFQKVQKSGTNEHLPPPRPKRKAAHPYPQKATKNSKIQSDKALSRLRSTCNGSSLIYLDETFEAQAPVRVSGSPLLESEYVQRPDSSSTRATPAISAPVAVAASWANNTVPAVSLPSNAKVPTTITNSCSSNEIAVAQPVSEPIVQVQTGQMPRVLPDFAQVYRFIGSVFDPDASNHLQKLKKMDLIDFETVLLLMRNLSINLTSPDFKEIRKVLSTYDTDLEGTNQCK